MSATEIVRNANYRQIGGPTGLLARRVPFTGNSMSAYVDSHNSYIVLSYSTEIARADERGTVTHNETKYSVTTSRQQNLCKAWL